MPLLRRSAPTIAAELAPRVLGAVAKFPLWIFDVRGIETGEVRDHGNILHRFARFEPHGVAVENRRSR
jgi:hypothetical protein